jgi:hypothetical protein
VRSTPGEGSTFSVFLPAAPGVPVSATTTGQMANPFLPARADPTPPPAPVEEPDDSPLTDPGVVTTG